MRMIVTATVVLSVAVLTGMVCGEHERYEVCNDALEILNSIKSCPDNYQQLLNAFYPINQAKPSSVIIAYFTNYTDPLPEECSLGTYPWRTYPGMNYTYPSIYWLMWTTSPIWCVGTNFHMQNWTWKPISALEGLWTCSHVSMKISDVIGWKGVC